MVKVYSGMLCVVLAYVITSDLLILLWSHCRRKAKKKSAKKSSKKSIFEIYEPSELKRGHFTDLDNLVRVH